MKSQLIFNNNIYHESQSSGITIKTSLWFMLYMRAVLAIIETKVLSLEIHLKFFKK